MTRPPSSQPAACRTKLAPDIIAVDSEVALSDAAWASGSFEDVNEPPQRNGMPSRRASCPTAK